MERNSQPVRHGAVWFARASAGGVALVAALVLTGWLLDIPLFESALPGYVAMKANTAIGLALAALALWLLQDPADARRRRTVALVCALVVVALGAVSSAEYLLGTNVGIDQLVFREPAGAIDTVDPGRMAPLTAVAFMLLGAALWAMTRPRAVLAAQAAALLTVEIGLLNLLGYLYRAEPFFRVGRYTPMAVPTAASFAALGVGVLCVRPDTGLMRTVTSDTAGGAIARRLLLPAVLLPVLFEWLALQGQRQGLLDSASNGALTAIVEILALGAAALAIARLLERRDLERQRAEEILRQANEDLESRVRERTADLEHASRVAREGEERFRAVTESASVAIVTTDRSGNIVGWNPAAVIMFGYTAEEIIGQPLTLISPHRYRERLLLGMERIRTSEASQIRGTTYERQGLRKDQSEFQLEFSAAPWENSEGSFVTAIIRDTTERQRTLDALEASEANFKALFNTASEAILVLDRDVFLACNHRAETLFGCLADDIVGRSLVAFSPREQSDGRLSSERAAAYIDAALTGAPQFFEWQHVRADGMPFDAEVSLNRVDVRGVMQLQAIVRDVSARKQTEKLLRESEVNVRQAEEKYRRLFEDAHHGIYQTTPAGAFLTANPAMARILGYSVEELTARSAKLAEQTFAAPGGRAEFLRILDRDGFVQDLEYEVARRDGSRRWVSETARAVRNDEGAVQYYEGTLTDITDRRQTAAALRRSHDLLELTGRLARVGGWELDVATQTAYWADEVARILGVDPAVHPSLAEAIQSYTPEARPVIAAAVQAAIDVGTPFDLELPMVTGLGRRIWVRTQGTAERRDGKTIRLYGAFQDITARKQSEEALLASTRQFQAVFEQASVGMVIAEGHDGRFVRVNRRFCDIVGYSADELLHLTSHDITHPDDISTDTDHVAQIGRGITRARSWERRYVKKDGTIVWTDVFVAPLDPNDAASSLRIGVVADITERRQAQEAERRLVAILEVTPDLVASADAEGRLVYMNHAGRRMLGLGAQADLAGHNIREFHDAANAHVVLTEGVPTAVRDGSWSGVTELLAPDGHAIAISQVIVAHKNPDGTVPFLSTIARDITERARAQRALQDSERLLKESQAIAGLGSYVFDIATTGRWTGSAKLDEIFGIDEHVDRTVDMWSSIVHPEWRERMIRYFAHDVLEQRGRFDMEYPIIRKRDGTTRWVHGLGELELDIENRPIRMIGTISDITERRQSETALRLQAAALYAAADAIVITDNAGVIEWVNPAFTQLTGYAVEDAIGRNPRDLLKSGKHAPAFYKNLWETILDGRAWHGQMINRRKDGSLYTENQSVTPILDSSGAITHFVAIKEDITERLQLEAQFRQAQKMESVGQLASGIAHDFNNLLTVINGTAELVLENVSADDPLRGDVQDICEAGARAATLTRQLLAFSRQQILAPQVLNLNAVVAGLASLLRRLLGDDIVLAVAPAPDLGNVHADPGQIEQVITNLAINARDAMPEGGKLTIETQNIEIDADYARQHEVAVAPGPFVQLTVSDSGVGMDEATRTRIFEPFFTTKRPGQGTGLGLSTVFGIVKQSHGFIWVYSEVGRGTSFKICLPRVTVAAEVAQAEQSVESSAGTETILLVEDNAGLRKLATRVLEPAGYTVIAAAEGEEAVRLVEGHDQTVHLLLSDVVMPSMSGRQLAERLAATRPEIKVLFMSGYTSDSVVRNGVLDASMPFLNKPFTAAALLHKVRQVLDS